MLELKPNCERCGVELAADFAASFESGSAYFCTFECTFCADCAEGPLAGSCPNCEGELVRRPRKGKLTSSGPSPAPPRRVVCLSQETAETLVRLGLETAVVGVSRFVARPRGAFAAAARIGGFSTTDVAAIVALEPDLVLCYSDVQAELTRELVVAGLEVHTFNHRDLAGMLAMVGTLARLMGVPERGAVLVHELTQLLESARRTSERLPESERPRVYFEEWDAPLVCGIHWVSELIELAGGHDVFRERAQLPSAKQRTVQPGEVLAAAPDVMLASWCGKPLDEARVRARPGWDQLPALRAGRLFDVEGAAILSPGPGLLTEGLALLRRLLAGT